MLLAQGHKPTWAKGALTSEGRAQLRAVDLHFHDLRYEAGCRWLEAGWLIDHVQEMLGHANLSQTSTCLHANRLLATSRRVRTGTSCYTESYVTVERP